MSNFVIDDGTGLILTPGCGFAAVLHSSSSNLLRARVRVRVRVRGSGLG